MMMHFAVLTDESKKRFRSIFMSAPIALDVDKFVVRLGTSSGENENTSEEGVIHEARIVWVGREMNDELQYLEWVAKLDAPSLKERAIALGASEDFVPELVFQSPATPMARSNKFWMESVHTSLVQRETAFSLQEKSIQSES